MQNQYKPTVKKIDHTFIGYVAYFSGKTRIFLESCRIQRSSKELALIDAEVRIIELEEKTRSLLYGNI